MSHGRPIQRRDLVGTTVEELRLELALYIEDIIDEIERPMEAVRVTANHTLGVPETLVLVDTAGGAITVTLPAANEGTGRIYWVVRDITITTGITVGAVTGDVNGGASYTLGAALYDHAGFASDGENYFTVSRHP